MINGKPAKPSQIKIDNANNRSIYRNRFSENSNVLNFKAIKGISATKRKDEIPARITKKTGVLIISPRAVK